MPFSIASIMKLGKEAKNSRRSSMNEEDKGVQMAIKIAKFQVEKKAEEEKIEKPPFLPFAATYCPFQGLDIEKFDELDK